MTLALQDTPPSTNVHKPTSLLGSDGCRTRLRISRDEPATGHIVELASRKCLVGADPRCDLRFNEPDVAPIACLIFHGAKNSVVRWFDSSREFVDGELFDDEVLYAGESLQIGPVELELLVDELIEDDEPRDEEDRATSEDRLAETTSRIEQLESQLANLQRDSDAMAAKLAGESMAEVAAAVDTLSNELAAVQSHRASDRQLWVTEKAELEASLQSRSTELDLVHAEIKRLRELLATVQLEYRNAGKAASARVTKLTQQLQEQTNAFEQQDLSWREDRSECQRQLRENVERLEQFQTQLDKQRSWQADCEVARQAIEARWDQLRDSVEELSAQLAEQQRQRQQAAELASSEPTVDSTAARGDVPNPTHADLAYLVDEYQATAYGSRDDHDQTVAGLDSTTFPAAPRADDGTAESPLSGVLGFNPYGPSIEEENVPEELELHPVSPNAPCSAADVLARLGTSGSCSDDESGVDESDELRLPGEGSSAQHMFLQRDESSSHDPDSADLASPPASHPPIASSNDAITGGSDDEEESIEDYMARLMNRVRVADDREDPFRSLRPAIERTPVTEYTEMKPAGESDEEESDEGTQTGEFNPDEYRPRSHAPELADRLTAMRSLANDSARSAIASHARRSWSDVMKLKLLVSVFAVVTVLASNIFFWGNPTLMGLGSLVGVSVLVYWALTAITYRKLVFESLMIEPETSPADKSSPNQESVS